MLSHEQIARVMDVYPSAPPCFGGMLQRGVIFLFGELTDELCAQAVRASFALAKRGQRPMLFINSPGGELGPGLALHSAARHIGVATVAIGSTAGLATLILASGTKGQRYAFPSARIQAWGPRPASDWFAVHGARMAPGPEFLTAKEAVSLGVIDSVLENQAHG